MLSPLQPSLPKMKRGADPNIDHPKRSRGGYLQRLAALEAETRAAERDMNPPGNSSDVVRDEGECPLSLLLIRLVLWGHISATLSQKIAAAAMESGASSLEIKRLAAAGSGATWAQNVWRDMRRRFISTPMSRVLSRIRLPVRATPRGRTTFLEGHVLGGVM